MTLYHLVIDSTATDPTFSPVEIVARIMAACKGKGEVPVDIYTTEVK